VSIVAFIQTRAKNREDRLQPEPLSIRFIQQAVTITIKEINYGEVSKMKFDISTAISVVAILVMFYCLFLTLKLGKQVPGGVVGKNWKFLSTLVVLFTAGYLTTPFFSLLPPELVSLMVSLIFFFGAIYVVITVKLIYRIIEELSA
jgi:hypothetical protein